MRKKIKMDLSVSSINNVIAEIEAYKNSLNVKIAQFLERLADIGVERIESDMKGVIGDSDTSHTTSVRVTSSGATTQAVITLQGEDILFIEFGAGVHYNGAVGQSPHPKGAEMGYTIGSYGEGHGAEDSWHYYDAESGHWKTSHGTQAAMPMYHASEEIKEKVLSIAKEVFG